MCLHQTFPLNLQSLRNNAVQSQRYKAHNHVTKWRKIARLTPKRLSSLVVESRALLQNLSFRSLPAPRTSAVSWVNCVCWFFNCYCFHSLKLSERCAVILARASNRLSAIIKIHLFLASVKVKNIHLANKAFFWILTQERRKADKKEHYSLRVCNNLSMAVFITGWPICSGKIPSISMTLQNNTKSRTWRCPKKT